MTKKQTVELGKMAKNGATREELKAKIDEMKKEGETDKK